MWPFHAAVTSLLLVVRTARCGFGILVQEKPVMVCMTKREMYRALLFLRMLLDCIVMPGGTVHICKVGTGELKAKKSVDIGRHRQKAIRLWDGRSTTLRLPIYPEAGPAHPHVCVFILRPVGNNGSPHQCLTLDVAIPGSGSEDVVVTGPGLCVSH